MQVRTVGVIGASCHHSAANASLYVHLTADLLRDCGIEQKPDEQLGDYVARGLNISEAQASALLEHLHEGGK
jgi:hypothetical protein